MPIFFQQNIDHSTKLAIWKIEEAETFFLAQVTLQREITHPRKRLQHLAGRYLLKHLYPDFPVELICIADTRKPFLEDEAYHFSISHCGDYAAVIVSSINRVGVDIEVVSEKIERIKHKFISQEEWLTATEKIEQQTFSDMGESKLQRENYMLTLLWSCKEAVFKWYGWGAIDFREHIKIQRMFQANENSFESIVSFNKKEALFLDLHSLFLDDLCLSWVIT